MDLADELERPLGVKVPLPLPLGVKVKGTWMGACFFADDIGRERGLDVYLSIWENSALLRKLGSLSVTWRT